MPQNGLSSAVTMSMHGSVSVYDPARERVLAAWQADRELGESSGFARHGNWAKGRIGKDDAGAGVGGAARRDPVL